MRAYAYDDITLIPNKAVVASRSQCDTSVMFLGKKFALPVIPANMKCSIDFDTAEWCRDNNIFYILHRFYPYDEIKSWLNYNHHKNISISIGVQPQDYEFITDVSSKQSRIDYLTIDIAHGHCDAMREMLNHIRTQKWAWGVPKIIAGNIAIGKAAVDLVNWGADAVKVGIGQGHVCTTRLQTGFGMPMYTCVRDVAQYMAQHVEDQVFGYGNVPIIADGGMSHYGDTAKAINAGATMVMAGSMFARCSGSPAEVVNLPDGNICKEWYGSASEENKKMRKYVEGRVCREPVNSLTYGGMLHEWKEALQSSISYAGGKKLSDIKYVKWMSCS